MLKVKVKSHKFTQHHGRVKTDEKKIRWARFFFVVCEHTLPIQVKAEGASDHSEDSLLCSSSVPLGQTMGGSLDSPISTLAFQVFEHPQSKPEPNDPNLNGSIKALEN